MTGIALGMEGELLDAWQQLVDGHPELESAARKPKTPRTCDAAMTPGRSWEDRHRHMRMRGPGGDGAAGRLRQLHIETGGAYGFEEFSDPDQLENCRECGGAIGPERLPRDDEGFVIRSTGGQPEYCSDRCYYDRRNRKRRNQRARKSGKRMLSTYSAAHGVPTGQTSTGPQERLPTGQVAPWTVPCWAADPWLKFAVAGSVPIGRGRETNHADPTGDTAARFVDHPSQRDYPDPAEGIPIGKRDHT